MHNNGEVYGLLELLSPDMLMRNNFCVTLSPLILVESSWID